MQKIVLSTTPLCSTCVHAKGVLSQKGVPFEEIDVSGKPDLRSGYDALFALNRKGELDPLLDGVS